jgi:hypothetical protein
MSNKAIVLACAMTMKVYAVRAGAQPARRGSEAFCTMPPSIVLKAVCPP